jgi:hypothetical protein
MKENEKDKLRRAYATLTSLRDNIAELQQQVHEKYVTEYHKALDILQGIGIDVEQFRIGESQLQRKPMPGIRVSYPAIPARPLDYSNERYVDKQYLLMKLDEILTYFETTHSEEPRPMGFSAPDRS